MALGLCVSKTLADDEQIHLWLLPDVDSLTRTGHLSPPHFIALFKL